MLAQKKKIRPCRGSRLFRPGSLDFRLRLSAPIRLTIPGFLDTTSDWMSSTMKISGLMIQETRDNTLQASIQDPRYPVYAIRDGSYVNTGPVRFLITGSCAE